MRSLERIVTLLPWCSSVCLSGTGVHCDHTAHFSADLSLRFHSPMFWAPWHHSMSTYSQPCFSSSTWKRGGISMCKLYRRDISENGWRYRSSYYWVVIGSHICRVDWHNNGWLWVILNGRFASSAVSAVAEFLVLASLLHAVMTKLIVIATMMTIIANTTTHQTKLKLKWLFTVILYWL